MSPEQQQTLFNLYPSLFVLRSNRSYPITYGIDTGNGWYGLLEATCSQLTQVESVEIQFVQVKEKFGTLRLYTKIIPKEDQKPEKVQRDAAWAQGVISAAEAFSSKICEVCGSAGVLRPGGWYRVLCDTCLADSGKKQVESSKDQEEVVEPVRT